MKENNLIQNLCIEDYAAEGKTIGKANGKIIFIPFAAKGDVVDVKIVKNKKKFAEGEIVKILNHSEHRTLPKCIHFGLCGGCKWQHLKYEIQLQIKQQTVFNALKHIGNLNNPQIKNTLASDETYFYRNKLEFTFTAARWLTSEEIESNPSPDKNGLGFHVPGRFDKIFDVTKCWLQPDLSNSIRNFVKTYALNNSISFFDLKNKKGILRNLIIRNSNTGEWMVILQIHDYDEKKISHLMNTLQNSFPEISSLYLVINTKGNETFSDLPLQLWSGKTHLTEKMNQIMFRIGPKTFFQTNSKQAITLYNLVERLANVKPTDTVYDLYTGAGTIANFIAKKAYKVIGIEYINQAVEDAKTNSKINNIHNTFFYSGDLKKVLNNEFVRQNGKPNVIITDPPRAGMDKEVIQQILTIEPEKIIYVSCNPSTQARDLNILKEKYNLIEVWPVDMFPQTHHCESVALLNLKTIYKT
jgi:23S rRNA (uracil1939-C5)-methyltransferase